MAHVPKTKSRWGRPTRFKNAAVIPDAILKVAAVWARSTRWFTGCERDEGVRRVQVATALVVAFLLPLFRATSACTPRVTRRARLADVRTEVWQALLGQGRLLRRLSERFGNLVMRLARSLREDIMWSGGDVVPCPVFVFFAKIVVCPGGGTIVFVVLWWYLMAVGLGMLMPVRLPCVGSLPMRLVAEAMVAMALVVAFLLPLFGATSACMPRVVRGARLADVRVGRQRSPRSRSGRDAGIRRIPNRYAFLKRFWPDRAVASSARLGEAAAAVLRAIRRFGNAFGALSPVVVRRLFRNASSVGCPKFCVSQARECSGLVLVVVLFSLHCSLACACEAAVGTYVHDYGTESGGTVVFVVLWWYLMAVGVEVELCSVEVVFLVTLAFELSVLVPSDSSVFVEVVRCDLPHVLFGPRQWFACETWSLGSGLPVRLEVE
ncbi:hypothetical protein Taro_045054, partial [Colocasia esculenta]|nr:hypothetical protein [Colocasia esculenta]